MLHRLDSAIQDLRRTPAEGAHILRTPAREGDVVINVLAHRGLDPSTFRQNVLVRSRIEHYRAKARVTISIGLDQRDTSQAFDTAQWLEGPWEHEDVMEKVLTEDCDNPGLVKVRSTDVKPGRNERCSCGSGKKFKRCWIDRITFERFAPES